MEKILTAVPYPTIGTVGYVHNWGIVCSDHPVFHGGNVPTDTNRRSAEAFAAAVQCGHSDHYTPGTEAELRTVDHITGEMHLFAADGRNLSVEAGAPNPGPFPPETAVNAVIVAAMLDHPYDSYWAERSGAYQGCDMTPVVRAVYQGPTDPDYCPDDVWVIDVQYSTKGGRALYGVNRNNVPNCYQD